MLSVEKFRLLGAALVIGVASMGAASLAQDKETVLKDRQATMKEQGKSLGAVKAYIDGKGDLAQAKAGAADLTQTTKKIPDLFPPGTGIGRWTDEQFLRALRDGVRPDDANYFPVFPYPSFTKITEADVRGIKAYLFSVPAMRQANRAHDVSFPFSWRFLQNGWKLLFFSPGPFRPAS